MGHENGGWMNDDQRSAVRAQAEATMSEQESDPIIKFSNFENSNELYIRRSEVASLELASMRPFGREGFYQPVAVIWLRDGRKYIVADHDRKVTVSLGLT